VAYYYVRDNAGGANTFNGSATGDGGRETTARTGAWDTTEANSYGTVLLAFGATTPPVSGDTIYVADDHEVSIGSVQSWGVASSNFVNIISLDITDGAVAKRGASETITTDLSLVGQAQVYVWGMDLSTTDDLLCTSGSGSWVFDNCSWTGTLSGSVINLNQDGSHIKFIDSTITSSATQQVINTPSNASTLWMRNVTITASGAERIFSGGGVNGGAKIFIDNCDFSGVTGVASDNLILATFGGDRLVDDGLHFIMQNTKVYSGLTDWVGEEFASQDQIFLATNCSSDSAAAEYQFYMKTFAGEVEDSGDDGTSGGIYRVASTAFTNGNKVSFKCTTSPNCSVGSPLTFDMPARYADLTAAGSNEITVYICQPNTNANLTTANTWIDVSYPDGTNKQTWNTVSSKASDILSSTELTTDSGSDWEDAGTDVTSFDEYKITVDTSSDAGAECVPHIRFYCTVPSITFYVDTTVDLS